MVKEPGRSFVPQSQIRDLQNPSLPGPEFPHCALHKPQEAHEPSSMGAEWEKKRGITSIVTVCSRVAKSNNKED